MTIIKTQMFTDGFRVRIEHKDDRYYIKSQQPTKNIACPIWEIHEDGYRDCLWCTASTLEDAIAEFDNMVAGEVRFGHTPIKEVR